ncbi:hypothetical protein HispidOSU_018341 [Sigmodon hispidus]
MPSPQETELQPVHCRNGFTDDALGWTGTQELTASATSKLKPLATMMGNISLWVNPGSVRTASIVPVCILLVWAAVTRLSIPLTSPLSVKYTRRREPVNFLWCKNLTLGCPAKGEDPT